MTIRGWPSEGFKRQNARQRELQMQRPWDQNELGAPERKPGGWVVVRSKVTGWGNIT